MDGDTELWSQSTTSAVTCARLLAQCLNDAGITHCNCKQAHTYNCLLEAIPHASACLYAKLLSPCKGVLIHPFHVLLNISIKFFIRSITAPLYQMGVLYAVSWRPAENAHLSICAAKKHAWICNVQFVMLTVFANAWLLSQGNSRESCCPRGRER